MSDTPPKRGGKRTEISPLESKTSKKHRSKSDSNTPNKNPTEISSDSSSSDFEGFESLTKDSRAESKMAATSQTTSETITAFVAALKDPNHPLATALQNALAPVISEAFEKQTQELKNKLAEKGSEISALKTQITSLEYAVEELEQYGRRNALRFSGIPENPGEKTDDIIMNIVNNDLKVNLESYQIGRSHRVGKFDANSSKPRNLLVKFATYNIRRQIFQARKELRQRKGPLIYINEDLTRRRAKLLYEARQLKSSQKIKNAWSSDGRILLADNADKTHLIKTEVDLEEFR